MKQFFGNELTLPCYSSFSSLFFFWMNFIGIFGEFIFQLRLKATTRWPLAQSRQQMTGDPKWCRLQDVFSWCQACEDVILYLVPCCLICLHSACYFYADWEPVLPRSLLDPFGFWQIRVAKFSLTQYLFSHNMMKLTCDRIVLCCD